MAASSYTDILKKIDCLFCRERTQRGKEHVFADALLKHFCAGREIVLLERRSFANDDLERSRNHSYDSFQAGGICKPCNEGWMSALEAGVLKLVTAVNSRQDLERFRDAERCLTFARWAVKTACVIDHVGMREIPPHIPSQLFRSQNSIPTNVSVLIGFHDSPVRTLFSTNQRNRWTFYPLDQVCKDQECCMDGMFFKVAFAVERLMTLVVGTPGPHFHPVIGAGGVHVPVWPENYVTNYHWFHSMRIEGCNAEDALRNFSDLFAAAHGGRMR